MLNTLNSGILQQHKHYLRMNLYTLFLFIIPTVLSNYHVWSPTSSFAFLLAQWSDQSETENTESYAILPGKRICRGNGLLFYLVIYRCTVALHILRFDLFESLSESHSEQNLNCESWQILTKPWESGGVQLQCIDSQWLQ